MKKTFLLCVALMVTAIASAQLELIKSITTTSKALAYIQPGPRHEYTELYLPPQFLYYANASGITLYDAENFEFYKDVTLPKNMESNYVLRYALKNFWTIDGKMAFIVSTTSTSPYLYLIDEDGNVLLHFSNDDNNFSFSRYDVQLTPSGKYVLFVQGYDRYNSHFVQRVYAIPGNGQPTEVETSPKYTPRAIRKAIRQGQILVDTPEYEYTITGQKVR